MQKTVLLSYFPSLNFQDFSASYLPRWACSRWGWSQWRACRSAVLFPARRRCPHWRSARSGPVDRRPSLSSCRAVEPALIPECLFLPPYTASGTTSWSPPWPPSPLTGLWRKENVKNTTEENVIEMASVIKLITISFHLYFKRSMPGSLTISINSIWLSSLYGIEFLFALICMYNINNVRYNVLVFMLYCKHFWDTGKVRGRFGGIGRCKGELMGKGRSTLLL